MPRACLPSGGRVSIKLMVQVWELDLSHQQQSVLLALADHADDEGRRCFPSVGRVSWKTGYSIRTVQRTLGELKRAGLIDPVAHEHGGRGYAAEYAIHVRKGVKKSPFVSGQKGDSKRERVPSPARKGVGATSPQPSSYPPTNHHGRAAFSRPVDVRDPRVREIIDRTGEALRMGRVASG